MTINKYGQPKKLTTGQNLDEQTWVNWFIGKQMPRSSTVNCRNSVLVSVGAVAAAAAC